MKRFHWKTIGKSLKDILFPRLCLVCGRRLLSEEKHLCINCLIKLPRTEYHLKRGNPCEQRFYGQVPALQRAASYFFYERTSPYKHILLNLKYNHQPEVGHAMGRLIARDFLLSHSSFFEGIDLIIPVPLAEKRLKQRGYNQCDFFAKGLSEVTEIPVGKDYITRAIPNESQTHQKNRLERMGNVEGIFEVRQEKALEGKHVLLVDDVLTTGATLISCASVLRHIEGIRISFLTIACVHH